jgi:hypothetical protein
LGINNHNQAERRRKSEQYNLITAYELLEAGVCGEVREITAILVPSHFEQMAHLNGKKANSQLGAMLFVNYCGVDFYVDFFLDLRRFQTL